MKIAAGLKYLYRALLRRDEYARYVIAEKLAALVYPKYKFSEFGRTFLDESEFLSFYERFCGTQNYHSLDRKYALDQMMKVVKTVDGDTAECGAYEGASSFLICRHTQGSGKNHHVFDSFEGLSTPGKEDGNYWRRGDLVAPESKIRSNLREFDFVRYHKGWIPVSFNGVGDRRFCFVHVDVDLYQPTWDSLCFFYERLSSGAVLLCDDYGFETCPGARQAIDSFFQDKAEEVVALPTGQAFVMKV